MSVYDSSLTIYNRNKNDKNGKDENSFFQNFILLYKLYMQIECVGLDFSRFCKKSWLTTVISLKLARLFYVQ